MKDKDTRLLEEAYENIARTPDNLPREIKRLLQQGILLSQDIPFIKNVLNNTEDIEDDNNIYMKLYNYYVDSGEMPYGIAKARTGDPDNWIIDRISRTQ